MFFLCKIVFINIVCGREFLACSPMAKRQALSGRIDACSGFVHGICSLNGGKKDIAVL